MADRAFLFDLDGTVWRGHEWYASVLAEVTCLSRTSIMASLATGGNIFQLSKEAGLSKERLIAACHSRIHLLTLYDNVCPTLKKLTGAGCKLGVVTSLPKQLADRPLSMLGLNQYFEVKRFAARKPSPKPLLTALTELNEEMAKRHFYVGDTATDAQCASRAGISFAWASYGYGKAESIEPHRVLHEFSDVLKL